MATATTVSDNKAHVAKQVQYRVVATARRKLAGCATPATSALILDTWCLNDDKLITNKNTNGDKFSGGTDDRCNLQANDGIGTGC